ncbi:MAG TPA: ArsR family transcriptional regulator [Thermoplasmatales archaeon]|nr:ArsR family transcriptional regulator [Thermoplasmatales archaeon]
MKRKISDLQLLELVDEAKTATEMAKILGVTRQAVSKRLKKLENNNLIDLSQTETKDRQLMHCSNEKIYKLTQRGKYYIEKLRLSGRGCIEDINQNIDNRLGQPIVEKHAYKVKIKIIKKGIFPENAQKNYKMKNWSLYYGIYLGCRYEITTKHIFLWIRARGKNTKEVNKKIKEKIQFIIQLFNHYGWVLGDPQVVNDGKIGIFNLPFLENVKPQKGKLADIDRTPVDPTIHPHNELDADRIVKLARIMDKLLKKHILLGDDINDQSDDGDIK